MTLDARLVPITPAARAGKRGATRIQRDFHGGIERRCTIQQNFHAFCVAVLVI